MSFRLSPAEQVYMQVFLGADITPHFACPRVPIASRGCWLRPQQRCRAHGTWQECQSTYFGASYSRPCSTHMRLCVKTHFHILNPGLERPAQSAPPSGTGLESPGVMFPAPGRRFVLSVSCAVALSWLNTNLRCHLRVAREAWLQKLPTSWRRYNSLLAEVACTRFPRLGGIVEP